jgi:serine/threonine protein phosphatase 1
MYEALVDLLKAVKYEPSEDELICLGDYIDRGPDSRKVVEFFMKLKKDHGSRVKLLKGNHEDMCVIAHTGGLIGGADAKSLWHVNSSDVTLESWDENIPRDVIQFMEDLPLHHEDKDFIFVHAGVDPDGALADSDPYALLWSRNALPHMSGKIVVAGHTIQETGVTFDARARTLLIDTGACGVVFGYSGRLSIVDLTANVVHFIRTDTGTVGREALDLKK